MRHAKITRARAWRAPQARKSRRSRGVVSALAFNVLLLILPIAAAACFVVIARDNLYAYEYSEAGARAISARVARLNAEIVQIDFDRQNQWDSLVAMELNAGDPSAARGFLLSATAMLPRSSAGVLRRAAEQGADDAALERAALQLLTPVTRTQYERSVELLSSGGETRLPGAHETPSFGDQEDFELLARAMLSEPEADPMQFILTGFALDLGGEFDARRTRGAAALLIAGRRDDYPLALAADIDALLADAVPMEAFRAAALENASLSEAGAFANASAAFRAAVNAERAARARAVLDQIGEVAEATSITSAALMLTHLRGLSDMPRLRLLAQAAGDRAAAAAKRLPRDGRLLDTARGQLSFTRDLIIALAVAGAAFAGLIGILAWKGFVAARRYWLRLEDDEYGGELVDISSTARSNWSPL